VKNQPRARLTESELKALTLRLDTPAHRLMAAGVGGAGTLVGVSLTGIPLMLRHGFLRLRYPHVLWFGLVTAGVGTAGGGVGHHLLVRVADGPMEKRALTCGAPVGLVTALAVWAVTYYGRRVISPVEPGPRADRVLKDAARIACVAGPVAGVSVSLLVLRVLKRRFGSDVSRGEEKLSRNG
jgi:hypothetical protein